MYAVEISGWRKGFNKVAHTKALQEFCKLGLGEAKARPEAMLDGTVVLIGVETQDRAEELATRLVEMGAIARVKTGILMQAAFPPLSEGKRTYAGWQ